MTSPAGPGLPGAHQETSRCSPVRYALLTVGWGILGAAITGAWLLAGLVMITDLTAAFGNPPDTYTGQDYDRATAWLYMAAFLFLTALLLAFAWLTARWRRAGRLR
jgi:hypothetical protein